MPASVHRPKVARCVQHVLDKDKSGDKGKAIRICQASIGESYRIPKAERRLAKKGGKALKQLRKEQAETKAEKLQARREKMGWNECSRCEGSGKAYGADRPFEWNGDWSYPGPCPKCHGTGQVASVPQLIETLNGFCPTGKGGGRDNSCHGAGGKLGSKADERRRKLRRLWERAKATVRTAVSPSSSSEPSRVSMGGWGGRAHRLMVNDLIEILNS